ncbi:MAG: ABC transporter substrate-binding protein [Victivallales bacterium]|jgi:iron complex transport system substrate-binding protein|nr:ABC transporter substrate-binding protein [Victivallales bacterium]
MAIKHLRLPLKVFLIALFASSLMSAVCSDASENVIFSSSSAATMLLRNLGALDRVVAVDRYGKQIPGTEKIIADPSMEKLAELKVNHALVWSYQSALSERLKQHGIHVTLIHPMRIATYPEFVRTIAAVAGKKAKGEEIIARFRAATPIKREHFTSRPRVYFELYSPFKSVTNESYLGDLLELSGGENILVKSQTNSASSEFVIKSGPEVILCLSGGATPEEIAKRPGFAELPAVKNGRIFTVDRLKVLEGADPTEAVNYLKNLIHRGEK